MSWKYWYSLDGIDAPEWMTEDFANSFCSALNSYIPTEYSTRGCRYHMLHHFPSGRLYFHLLNRPVGV